MPDHYMRNAAPLVCSVVGAFLLFPLAADAQSDPVRRLGPAIGAHLGFTTIEKADNTIEAGVYADVGSVRWERMRVIIGVDYLSSSSTRSGADGSFNDVTLNGDLRYKPFNISGVTPYIGAGLGIHVRSTDATNPLIKDIYDGIAVGVNVFGGALVDLSEDGRTGALGELRRVQAQNVNRTAFRLGMFFRF